MKRFLWGMITGLVGAVLIAGVGAALFMNLASGGGKAPKVYAEVAATETLPSVAEHSKRFERRIEEPLPGVHVAIGYGLANAILIEAPAGLIMVDTLETIEAANDLLPFVRSLRDKTGKDITDIIYTHNHTDHVFGAGVFAADQPQRPNIWAHDETAERVHEVVNVLRPALFRRSMRQFGVFLPEDAFENAGIGARLRFDETTSFHFVRPSRIVEDGMTVELAGEQVVFRHAPGESADQLMIHLPGRDTILAADNFYHAFPNLYAIRGTPYRDVLDWARTIDRMLGYDAAVLIPQHGPPLAGRDEIRQILTDYRDAIQFVHDQTIRMINKGLTPDEIVEVVKLPAHLAQKPYLQEFYGRVEWAVRSVFSGTLGWFSGDPADLLPVSPTREAELLARLGGGRDALQREYDQAMREGEPEWALTLAGHLKRLGDATAPALQARALRALAEAELSASGRNYMLTMAAEAEGWQMPKSQLNDTPAQVFEDIPIANFMGSLLVTLRAEEVLNAEMSYGFDFTDLPEPMTVRIRRGVAVLETGLAVDRLGTLATTTATFKGVVTKRLTPIQAIAAGDRIFDTGPLAFNQFMAFFETE